MLLQHCVPNQAIGHLVFFTFKYIPLSLLWIISISFFHNFTQEIWTTIGVDHFRKTISKTQCSLFCSSSSWRKCQRFFLLWGRCHCWVGTHSRYFFFFSLALSCISLFCTCCIRKKIQWSSNLLITCDVMMMMMMMIRSSTCRGSSFTPSWSCSLLTKSLCSTLFRTYVFRIHTKWCPWHWSW